MSLLSAGCLTGKTDMKVKLDSCHENSGVLFGSFSVIYILPFLISRSLPLNAIAFPEDFVI